MPQRSNVCANQDVASLASSHQHQPKEIRHVQRHRRHWRSSSGHVQRTQGWLRFVNGRTKKNPPFVSAIKQRSGNPGDCQLECVHRCYSSFFQVEEISEVPLVVEDKVESFEKTKEAVQLLRKLKAWTDVEKVCKSKRFRAGKGKMRNRRRVMRQGPCIVYNKDNGIRKSFRNIPGKRIGGWLGLYS